MSIPTTNALTALRTAVHAQVEAQADEAVLRAVLTLLERVTPEDNPDGGYLETPPHVRAALKRALAQADRGETIPHEEAMRRIHANRAAQ